MPAADGCAELAELAEEAKKRSMVLDGVEMEPRVQEELKSVSL